MLPQGTMVRPTFTIRPGLILFTSDKPGSHATMFGPRGKLEFNGEASKFDNDARRFTWAFEFLHELEDGQQFVFCTSEREVAGTVKGLRIEVTPLRGSVDRTPDGKPLGFRGTIGRIVPLKRLPRKKPKPMDVKKLFAVQTIFADDTDRSAEDFGAAVASVLEAAGLRVARFLVRQLDLPDAPVASSPAAGAEDAAQVPEMESAEHALYINYVPPGAVGRAIIPIPPRTPRPEGAPPPRWDVRDGKPFRLNAIIATDGSEGAFKLAACFVGGTPLPLPEGGASMVAPVVFESTDDRCLADIGQTVTVYVQNTSTERRAFTGRLVGVQRK